MKNRRFVLVVMDSTGRSVRRVGVSRRSLEIAAAVLGAVALVTLVLMAHAAWRYGEAAEARDLRLENQQLDAMIGQLEHQLPELRRLALRSETSFAQLWSKSGLGVEPRLLAAGPFENDDRARLPGSDQEASSPVNGDLLDLEPLALPLELERLRQDSRTVQHDLGELLEYFHDAERVLSHTPSVKPTKTPWITSSFGRRRDPIHHVWMMHKGLDLGGQVGFSIVSPADGVVIFTGRRGGYGLTVVVDHGFGLQTHFAHLSRTRVFVGQRVERGDVIAEMGSTGKSTGPHLHYEVRQLGQPLDPRRFILD
ncbi:MAG: M23 family metallopeptidase [Deltaproteobacteria bacterium]|nr:M23 family metallopeptidase [Deltaproteobacteria bacterium]